MVLETHQEFFVKNYKKAYKIYKKGGFATYDQMIPEDKKFDESNKSDLEKIKELLSGDEYNVYVVKEIVRNRKNKGKKIIGYAICMVVINIYVDINEPLGIGDKIYFRYGEHLTDQEYHTLGEKNTEGDDHWEYDSDKYELSIQ